MQRTLDWKYINCWLPRHTYFARYNYCIHFQVSNSKTRKSKQKSNFEDVRNCQFCGELGDKGQGGRLLHFRHNEWVHVNCALWSSEVYEEVDGSLQNVGQALTRGLKLNCTLCSKKGASIGKNTTFQDFLCLLELVWTCSNGSKLVQIGLNLSKLV